MAVIVDYQVDAARLLEGRGFKRVNSFYNPNTNKMCHQYVWNAPEDQELEEPDYDEEEEESFW